MYIYKNLYTDDQMKQKYKAVIRKIRMNIGQLDVYLICLAKGQDYFDIIDVKQLKQKQYPKDDLYILGIAKGYDSAVTLSISILQAFMQQYNGICFKQKIQEDIEQLFWRK